MIFNLIHMSKNTDDHIENLNDVNHKSISPIGMKNLANMWIWTLGNSLVPKQAIPLNQRIKINDARKCLGK